MGMYINPQNGMTNKEWLKANGSHIVTNPTWPPESGRVYLSWVDNGFFDALGVCFSKLEFEAWQWIDKNPQDIRPYFFFEVAVEAVMSPESGITEVDREILKNSKEVWHG